MSHLQRLLLPTLVLILCAVVAASAAPRLEVIGGTQCDLGAFGAGTYHGKVYITNVGDQRLKIIDVKSSCGCLYGRSECKSLAPGDTCSVEWQMAESSGRKGEHVKTVTITTNDSINSRTVISFRWITRVDLEDVSGGSFLVLKYDSTRNLWRAETKLTNVGEDTLVVSLPQLTPTDAMELKELLPSAPVRLAPSESFTLSVAFRREKEGTGFKPGYCVLQLKTSGRYTPNLSLTVVGNP